MRVNSRVNRAEVALNGFSLDRTNSGHRINVVAIDVECARADRTFATPVAAMSRWW